MASRTLPPNRSRTSLGIPNIYVCMYVHRILRNCLRNITDQERENFEKTQVCGKLVAYNSIKFKQKYSKKTG